MHRKICLCIFCPAALVILKWEDCSESPGCSIAETETPACGHPCLIWTSQSQRSHIWCSWMASLPGCGLLAPGTVSAARSLLLQRVASWISSTNAWIHFLFSDGQITEHTNGNHGAPSSRENRWNGSWQYCSVIAKQVHIKCWGRKAKNTDKQNSTVSSSPGIRKSPPLLLREGLLSRWRCCQLSPDGVIDWTGSGDLYLFPEAKKFSG